ncbi:hypothetical protein KFK09_001771 [Dendrobium nobile]|uniref:Uncharacterized protein n=2 Tax=Dendrobium TaxID=37818 RepID=A0A8T3C957_DENNO|nr:hypothetical protein KFK09_001771 [Dendrobium nobile]
MEVSQFVEDQNYLEKEARVSSLVGSYRMTTTFFAPKGPTLGSMKEVSKEKIGGDRFGGNFKKLTEKELQMKRTRGLCFRCDEKYMPGHKCKDQTFQVLTVCGDEKAKEGGESGPVEEEEEKLHLDVSEVSLNYMVEFTQNHTMKLKGEIDDREVLVLIDSGATHNFISNQIVDLFGGGVKLVDTGAYGGDDGHREDLGRYQDKLGSIEDGTGSGGKEDGSVKGQLGEVQLHTGYVGVLGAYDITGRVAPYKAKIEAILELFNGHEFNKWVEKGVAPAINSSLKLYMEVLDLGFKIFLLTGRSEAQRAITADNLNSVGFQDWEKLILRGTGDERKSAMLYKSEKRSEMVADGYRIHGNSGDQWSDLLGSNTGNRSFKLPNPMYYIP